LQRSNKKKAHKKITTTYYVHGNLLLAIAAFSYRTTATATVAADATVAATAAAVVGLRLGRGLGHRGKRAFADHDS